MSKLTESQVLDIRSRYDQKIATKTELAKIYGVRYSNVEMIVKRKTWRHLT